LDPDSKEKKEEQAMSLDDDSDPRTMLCVTSKDDQKFDVLKKNAFISKLVQTSIENDGNNDVQFFVATFSFL
jgi:hypothetical protein